MGNGKVRTRHRSIENRIDADCHAFSMTIAIRGPNTGSQCLTYLQASRLKNGGLSPEVSMPQDPPEPKKLHDLAARPGTFPRDGEGNV